MAAALEAMRRLPTHCPGTMNTKHDTITVLLAVALEVAEAITVLIVALVALLLTVARWRPSQAPAVPSVAAITETATGNNLPVADQPALLPVAAISDAPPIPLLHPLAVVAEQLEALPVTRLRPMANTRSKRARKHELVAALVAC